MAKPYEKANEEAMIKTMQDSLEEIRCPGSVQGRQRVHGGMQQFENPFRTVVLTLLNILPAAVFSRELFSNLSFDL